MRDRYMRDRMIQRDRAMRGDYRGRDYRRGDYGRDYTRGIGRDYGRLGGDYQRREYDERTHPMSERLHRTAFEYGDFTDDDFAEEDEELMMELEDWCKDLKRQVRNPLTKKEVITKAEQMGVRFDEYNEKEFYVTVMMLMSDFPNIGQPETYIAMAKQWLEDKDAELTGSEKLSAYYYTIVRGE